MSPTLDFYYYEECPYCRKVMRVIDELKIQVNYCNTRKEANHLNKLMKDTGLSQVPCLYIDGKPMFETSDIMNWLRENQAQLKKD